jgi:hypothetical protein
MGWKEKRESLPNISKRQQEIFANEGAEAMHRWQGRREHVAWLIALAAPCHRCIRFAEITCRACATDAEIQKSILEYQRISRISVVVKKRADYEISYSKTISSGRRRFM